jgi:hypothetical protein
VVYPCRMVWPHAGRSAKRRHYEGIVAASRRAYLHEGALGARHADGLGAAVLGRLDGELHRLALAQGAEALGVKIGLSPRPARAASSAAARRRGVYSSDGCTRRDRVGDPPLAIQ